MSRSSKKDTLLFGELCCRSFIRFCFNSQLSLPFAATTTFRSPLIILVFFLSKEMKNLGSSNSFFDGSLGFRAEWFCLNGYWDYGLIIYIVLNWRKWSFFLGSWVFWKRQSFCLRLNWWLESLSSRTETDSINKIILLYTSKLADQLGLYEQCIYKSVDLQLYQRFKAVQLNGQSYDIIDQLKLKYLSYAIQTQFKQSASQFKESTSAFIFNTSSFDPFPHQDSIIRADQDIPSSSKPKQLSHLPLSQLHIFSLSLPIKIVHVTQRPFPIDQGHPLPSVVLPAHQVKTYILPQRNFDPFSRHLHLLVLAPQFQPFETVHPRSLSQSLQTHQTSRLPIVLEFQQIQNTQLVQIDLSKHLHFVESLNPQKMQSAISALGHRMHNQQFNPVRRNAGVGHTVHVPHVLARNVVGEEVVVFVGRTATVQFQVAPGCRFAKIAQFRETSAADCHQTQLLDHRQTVYIFSLDVLPLSLARYDVDPVKSTLVAKYQLVLVAIDRTGQTDVLLVYRIEFDALPGKRLLKNETANAVTDNHVYFGGVVSLFDPHRQHFLGQLKGALLEDWLHFNLLSGELLLFESLQLFDEESTILFV